jgi:hypothetical protein
LDQFRVIRHVTQSLGGLIEREVSAAIGAPVQVLYGYTPEARSGSGSITVIHCSLDEVRASLDREYERVGDEERFRAGSLNVKSRFFVSAWADPPADLDLLGAVLRTFHDHTELQLESWEDTGFVYDEAPQIKPSPMTLAEHKLLADGYGMPLAPSICYTIEYRIQSVRTTTIKRVRERVIDIRKIDG